MHHQYSSNIKDSKHFLVDHASPMAVAFDTVKANVLGPEITWFRKRKQDVISKAVISCMSSGAGPPEATSCDYQGTSLWMGNNEALTPPLFPGCTICKALGTCLWFV